MVDSLHGAGVRKWEGDNMAIERKHEKKITRSILAFIFHLGQSGRKQQKHR